MRAWPFAGRDEELRFIAETYHEAGVSGVVVAGDAGVGKTRLVREALARLATPGRRIEWVTATRPTAAVALGAVSHLLPADCPDDGGLSAGGRRDCRPGPGRGARHGQPPGVAPGAIVPAAAGATMAATMLGRFDYSHTTFERAWLPRARSPNIPGDRRCWASPGACGTCSPARHSRPGCWPTVSSSPLWTKALAPVAGIWAVYRGIVARLQGNLDLAAVALREAAVLLEGSDPYQLLRVGFAELAAVAALSGDATDATRWLDRADNGVPPTLHPDPARPPKSAAGTPSTPPWQ